jgi:RING-variant domain
MNLEDVDDVDDPTGVGPNNPQPQLTSQSPTEYLTPATGYYAANSNENTLRCLRTGVVFPSSSALTLLGGYDDGLTPPVTIPLEGQNVFCRICREGLHDDDENGLTETGENPLLSPCECSGSMAFVHYLCVEQWRCRSRHPEARNGTHCETCSKPYALPPPSSRPVSQVEEEWLEAMPPHVMAALRQPHFGWQIGAALVRRRWFRPMAPIFISPLVALYCRARRLLKKRGVSRRRWACSLCRRRARWKCVRCLRSYYCSRQCQNVSWHIVHKHVCYKPSRFWWSVVVYGAILLFMIPGILRDPLYYDLAFSFIPPSFYIMAVIGGGVATLVKKFSGVDMRGRILESVVVVLTVWLVLISWGLVAGMFGRPQSCIGMLRASYKSSYVIQFMNRFILGNAKTYFLLLDQLAMRHLRVKKFLCTALDGGCFPHLSKVSPELLLSSPACVGDAQLVSAFWITAGATLAIGALLRKRRRGGHQRLHQD